MAKGRKWIQKRKIVFSCSADYMVFGEKYLPPDIIWNALTFSWGVQSKPIPERFCIWGNRDLDQLLWNSTSREWLLSATRSRLYQNLLIDRERREIFTILAKSLGMIVVKRSLELQ